MAARASRATTRRSACRRPTRSPCTSLDRHASYVRGQAGQPLFDDSNPNRYFKNDQPTAGVKVAGSGTKIRVLEEKGTSVKIRIDTRAVTP